MKMPMRSTFEKLWAWSESDLAKGDYLVQVTYGTFQIDN
jgi:hypothetical protein